jgi:hypothetical protein
METHVIENKVYQKENSREDNSFRKMKKVCTTSEISMLKTHLPPLYQRAKPDPVRRR